MTAKERRKKKSREWYLKNRELTIARAAAWAKANPQKRKEQVKKSRQNMSEEQREAERKRVRVYQAANRETCRNSSKAWYSRHGRDYCDKIEDRYVKQLLTRGNTLCAGDIPQQLIDAKRAELQLKRILQ